MSNLWTGLAQFTGQQKKAKKIAKVNFNFPSMSKPKISSDMFNVKVPDIFEICLTYRLFKKQDNG